MAAATSASCWSRTSIVGMCVPQFAQFQFDLLHLIPPAGPDCRIYRIGEDQSGRAGTVRDDRGQANPRRRSTRIRGDRAYRGGETRHRVTMARDTCERLTAGRHTPVRCIEAAFQFLLDREPKESILRHFDVTVISHYFPEFERELPRYLSQP